MLNTITDAIHSLAPNISVVITVVLLYLGKKTADKLVDEVLKDLIASGKKFLEKRKQKRQQSLRKQISLLRKKNADLRKRTKLDERKLEELLLNKNEQQRKQNRSNKKRGKHNNKRRKK